MKNYLQSIMIQRFAQGDLLNGCQKTQEVRPEDCHRGCATYI